MLSRSAPVSRCGSVSSGNRAAGGINGLKFAASGLFGRAPMISGYSCGGLAVSTLAICQRFQKSEEKSKRAVYLDPFADSTLFSARTVGHVKANQQLRETTRAELTIRGIVIGVIITLVFTAANIYAGLKAALTFSTSIPAAVISMAILRSFRDATIQENNIVQTVASAAGTLSSIIFVLPGLIMIGYWSDFPFWTSFWICALGGILGVMYSIPLRRALVTNSDLPYPEGVACAEVLKVGSSGSADVASNVEQGRAGLLAVLWGSIVSAAFALIIETQIFAADVAQNFRIGRKGGVTGYDFSLSFLLFGIGHLVGLSVGIAMLIGALIGWLLGDFGNASGLGAHLPTLIIGGVVYIVLMSFFVSAVCGYMAGLIGSSNSPLSGIGILVVIGAALLLVLGVKPYVGPDAGKALIAFALFTTAVVFNVAAIANNNLQDLKTGQLVDATPWKQQVALVIGVIAGAFVIPPVLDLVNHAYGFVGAPGADLRPHPLPAPQAGLISSLGKGVISGDIDWSLIRIGGMIGVGIILLDEILRRTTKHMHVPPLAVGLGIYLPTQSTLMIVVGAIVGWLFDRRADRTPKPEATKQLGVLRASGLIVGGSSIGLVISAIVVFSGKDAPLSVVGPAYETAGIIIGGAAFVVIAFVLYRWILGMAAAKST